MKAKLIAAALTCAAFVPLNANAATLNFDGAARQGGGIYTEGNFTFDDIRIVSGACPGSAPCGALNKNETSVLTSITGAFSLESLAVNLLGSKTVLTLTTNLGTMFDITSSGLVDLTDLSTFDGVTSIAFTANLGNVRIDDLTIGGVSPVPLPAGGLLLGSVLAMLGLVRRRRFVRKA